MGSDVDLRKGFDRSCPNFSQGTPFWNDSSFQMALERHLQLREVTVYLPPDLETKIFAGQADIETLWSSYKDHGYGYFFYALTRVLKPARCVEIGVLQGFSLLTVAAALRDNGNGMIHGFDLFEDYPYRHEKYANVLEWIETSGLRTWATVSQEDAFQVHKQFDTTDYLHVDISNDGNTYRRVFEQWAGKVKKVILLEGGSADRDRVEWMIKYKKPSIVKALNEIRSAYPSWDIVVFDPYPSLTVALPVVCTSQELSEEALPADER